MVDPLIFVSEALILSAKRGDFFYISLGVFCFELVLGALYLLWLSTFTDLKKMSVKWLGGLYRICFFCDLFLCVTHALYSQIFVVEISSALLACLVKYMLLIALYALVLAHKWVLNERERDALKSKKGVVNSLNKFEEVKKTDENNPLLEGFGASKEISKCKIADVNVAYLRAVINGLKGKNLTDEDRERICNLEFSLKVPAIDDLEGVKRLNSECEFLIKKMTEYGVSV